MAPGTRARRGSIVRAVLSTPAGVDEGARRPSPPARQTVPERSSSESRDRARYAGKGSIPMRFVARDVIAARLNPLTMSQTARLISQVNTGIAAIDPHAETCS
jgi:hypothetical protein